MPRAKPLFPIGISAVKVLARLAAKNAVKEQMRDAGIRITVVPPREIAEKASAYLATHPELYRQALERARRLGLVAPAEPLVTPMEWLTERKS